MVEMINLDFHLRYFLKLRVIDDADSVEVVVFYHNVRALIERSYDDVYEMHDSTHFGEEIKNNK